MINFYIFYQMLYFTPNTPQIGNVKWNLDLSFSIGILEKQNNESNYLHSFYHIKICFLYSYPIP